ncbi:type II secretion system F family protein [Sneathiella limimaris]|uniref:type II secretion system F family protein n=1 Tax=Sneathiella limimaris TaxID=1964213 RepID=UPI00146D8A50|nr:type II secretion system F family protein [Sneathiella limimaris]
MFAGEDQLMLMLIVGGGTLFVTLVLGFALVGGDNASANTKRRLANLSHGHAPVAPKAGQRNSARIDDRQSSIKVLDTLARKLIPKPAELKARLEKTGKKLTTAEYALICLVTMAVVIVVMRFVYDLTWLLSIPVGLTSGLILPHWTVGFMGARRVNKFMKHFPEAIELMVRSLRAGIPISEAIATVANDAPEPIATEFKRVSDTVKLGKSVEDGLWKVAKRIDLPDFKFLIIAISIQRETGGNLAETLAGLANMLRKRRQIKLKIKAMSSEARASAWIIGSLPFIMFFLLWLANDEYVMTLINDPRGIYLIGAGLTMIASGVGVMAKMVRFEI